MRSDSEHVHGEIDLDRLEFLQRKCQQLANDISRLQHELSALTDPRHRCVLPELSEHSSELSEHSSIEFPTGVELATAG